VAVSEAATALQTRESNLARAHEKTIEECERCVAYLIPTIKNAIKYWIRVDTPLALLRFSDEYIPEVTTKLPLRQASGYH